MQCKSQSMMLRALSRSESWSFPAQSLDSRPHNTTAMQPHRRFSKKNHLEFGHVSAKGENLIGGTKIVLESHQQLAYKSTESVGTHL